MAGKRHLLDEQEDNCGIDEPVIIIVNPSNKKALHISRSTDVVRVHKAFRRRGKTWKSGHKIKILKGGFHNNNNNNVYATLEYFLLEGFPGDAAGDAWIICRTIDVSEKDGCLLESAEENPQFELRKSVSIPINVIDSGKCLEVDDSEWNNQYQKCPSTIEILNTSQSRELGIESSLPDELETYANDVSATEIVAVVRPATYISGMKDLDQKHVMKDNFEMLLVITYSTNKKSQDKTNIYSGHVEPSSLRNFHGLYVFKPRCKSHPPFQKAGIYTFTFSIRDSSCEKCVVKVQVKPSRHVHRWALAKKISHHNLTVGCPCKPISVSRFDKYNNQIPFLEVPKISVKINCPNATRVLINGFSPSISINKLGLVLEDLVVEGSGLDRIRPSYDASMMLLLPGSHLDIPIKVLPGSVQHCTIQPRNFEKQLIPGTVIKELNLELFDAYGNHVQENEKVELSVDGFCWLGRSSSSMKVDACGCIDLGGLLRVTACFGRKVSLSICSNEETRVSKEWQIQKRKLRISSEALIELPSEMETMDICHAMARVQEADIESCLEFQKDLWNEITKIGLRIGKLEQEIRKLEDLQKTIEVNLSECEGIRGRILSIGKHDSLGKDQIMARVESKSDCAGSLVMKHLKAMRDQDRHGLMRNIIGIVALLGTTPSFELSRLFAEYLGEQMLAVVCKHYEDGRLLEGYDKNWKLNPGFALHMFARELGQSINGRFLVLCIEDIRACEVDKDVEGKLLFPGPTLPDGSTPAGFLGYAVNMINIDDDHLDTKADSGCGLRETLFYRLFGETQVYETRQDMKRAILCVNDGALSMDGGILRGNGAMSLGCLEPDIIFPVVPAINHLSENDTQVLKRYRELKLKLKETIAELVEKRKSHVRDLKRFYKRRDLYAKYFIRVQEVS